MAPLSHKLASLLAIRLGMIVPVPMSVRADGSLVLVHADSVRVADSNNAVIADEDDDRTFGDKVGCAVWGVLSMIQDDISEYLTEPWPAYGRRMALPGVREAKGRVFFWYGDDEAAPLISFASIGLDEIQAC